MATSFYFRYNFTVTVSKGSKSDSASMMVEVTPGNPPVISPIDTEDRYNPTEGFTIKGKE